MSAPGAGILRREMRLADLRGVATIDREAFSRPWGEESLREELRRPPGAATTRAARADGVPRGVTRVAVSENRVAGYVILWVLEREAHVARIAVARADRRRGIARALMEDVIAVARAAEVAHVVLEVRGDNDGAHALYTLLGFVTCGVRKGYYADGPGAADARVLLLTL